MYQHLIPDASGESRVYRTQPNPTSNTVHQVTVECTTEASPKAITYWVFKVDCSLFRNNTKECNHLLAVQGCDDPPVSAPPHRGGGRGLSLALAAHHPPGWPIKKKPSTRCKAMCLDKVYIGCPPGDQVGLWGVQVREQELSWRDGGSDPALRDCLRVNGGNPQPHRAHQQGAPRQTHNQVALKLLVVARVNLFFQANLSL